MPSKKRVILSRRKRVRVAVLDWQAMEREADAAIAQGEVSEPQSVEDAIASLRAGSPRSLRNRK